MDAAWPIIRLQSKRLETFEGKLDDSWHFIFWFETFFSFFFLMEEDPIAFWYRVSGYSHQWLNWWLQYISRQLGCQWVFLLYTVSILLNMTKIVTESPDLSDPVDGLIWGRCVNVSSPHSSGQLSSILILKPRTCLHPFPTKMLLVERHERSYYLHITQWCITLMITEILRETRSK